ncbi:IS30 family transposase [Solobacterium moorei]|uniref:IS30 family transposase n=1 Tax=Solobacterium moorei TaxID=102148 RepID=UPI002B2AA7B4|nr:IS30-like element ISSmi3 family transposase [Solobacterium moorei]
MVASGYKHLSLEERKSIEVLLNHSDITLKQIALSINHSSKCVREGIRAHRVVRVHSNKTNKCGRQDSCKKHRLCTYCISGDCKSCKHKDCNELCDDFVSYPVCERIERFPYVCSGCPDIHKCHLPKYFYIARIAQDKYTQDKLEWRSGPRKSEAEMKSIVEAFQNNIPKKQSIDTIIHTNDLNISASTAYRYIREHQIPGISNIDLKRQVRYTQRSSSRHHPISIDYDFLEGRKYEDFLAALETAGPDVNVWEMDTIIGKKGSDEKCVLSLLHRRSNLQLYFLLRHKNMFEVTYLFDTIKSFLGIDLFKDTFTIILTDNGTEFHDPLSLETDPETGEKLISIYFARPRRSDDKGKCEKNHEHFREKIPKGCSMNSLTKYDINFVSNQVNNYVRRKLNYQSPYSIAKLVLNEKVLELNRLHPISPKAVDLTPILH